MKYYNTLSRKLAVFLFSILFVFLPDLAKACSSSGYTIDNLIDNGDGTFTIQMTVLVSGANDTPSSTWGFYWNVDVPILSVTPPSLTSSNGTTLNAVINGMSIEWGDPTPSANIPFVDINTSPTQESFPVTVVVQGPPLEWDGGGMEANTCPGASGTNIAAYEGEFPCFEPQIIADPVFPICEGADATLNVTIINTWLPDNMITWTPGDLPGSPVVVSPTQTTTYTATVTNYCGETTVDVEVEVVPAPSITAADDNLEVCNGLPAVLEVFPQNAGPVVYWDPGGPGATFYVDIPPSFPFVYTATVYSMTLLGDICDSASVDITVNEIPPPMVDIITPPTVLCVGESITIETDTSAVSEIAWAPTADNTFEIEVSPDTTTTYTAIATSQCGLDTANITIQVAGSAAQIVELSACEGESVTYNGIPLAAGTSSTFTFETFAGCDSVVTVNVAELLNVTESLQLTACENETVTYNGTELSPGDSESFTFTAFNGCDSTVNVTVMSLSTYTEDITLEACTGETVSYNGTTMNPGDVMDFTLTAFNGCDSVVTVTVNELQTYTSNLPLQTCTGTTITYAGVVLNPGDVMDFTLTAFNGCDSVVTVSVEELAIFTESLSFDACTGTTISYNGNTLNPGTVTDFNFVTANGCDSVVTVTVNEVTAILDTLDFQACTGETVLFDGVNLNPGTSTDFPYVTAQGCDSIVTVNVEELQIFSSPLELSACTGETADYNGSTLNPGDVVDFTLTAFNGCDSTVTVTVVELLPTTEAMTLTSCANETVTFNGMELAPGSVTDFTFVNFSGCDSTLTVTVDELPTYASPLTLQACTGSTISYNGVPLPPGTAIDFTLTAINGCDSVVTVTVNEVETIFEEVDLATCAGGTVLFDGVPLGPNTVTDFTYQSYLGCDSVVTVTVDELGIITESLDLTACENGSVIFNGTELLPGSVTDFNFVTPAGCDSVLTVSVASLPTQSTPLTFDACTGTTIDYNGTPLAPNTVTDFTFTTWQGCDSVVTVTVNETLPAFETVNLSACTGTTADYNGTPLSAGTTTEFNFFTWQGCDSTVTVEVEELVNQTGVASFEACTGTFVNYAGQQLAAGSVTDVVLSTYQGCDSVVTVTVTALEILAGSETLQGCEGEALFYQGVEVPVGTSMDFTLTASTGCDSIVTVTSLNPLPSAETSEFVEICEGTSVLVFGQLIASPGEYTEVFTSVNGCDSTHTITVGLAPDLILDLPDAPIEIDFGDEITLNPIFNPNDLLTFTWQPDPTLSCLDCPNPVASPLEQTTYFLSISTAEGCTAEDNVQVFVRRRFGVYIPNSFSPNGDGINDVFMIFSDPDIVANVKSLRVYSRWGESVFQFFNFPPNDAAFGWDGFFRSELMNSAVFVYTAEIEFIDGSTRLFKGDVTLMK